MSESDSFFHEVSEEIRRDKLYAFFRRYAWAFVAIVVLIVGGAGANEYLKAQNRAAAQAAGDALQAASLAGTPEAFAEVAASDAPSAVLAAFGEAAAQASAGDTGAAVETYLAIASATGTPDIFVQLALLKAVTLGGADMPESEFAAAMGQLTAPEAPFRMLALEQQALAYLRTGERAAAVDVLKNILTSSGVTRELASRVQQLLTALGEANAG